MEAILLQPKTLTHTLHTNIGLITIDVDTVISWVIFLVPPSMVDPFKKGLVSKIICLPIVGIKVTDINFDGDFITE
jgi:hypothetical protein